MAQAETRYLLAVYQLCKDGGEVRSVDVADFLAISRPSVAKQMKLLLARGLIEKRYYGGITLTPEGARQASAAHLQFTLVRAYLQGELGLDEQEATRDAIACVCELSSQCVGRMGERALREATAHSLP